MTAKAALDHRRWFWADS